MAEAAGEKSEPPTPHRLREAREKGQVAKSKELTTAILLLLSFLLLRYLGTYMWGSLVNMGRIIFHQIPNATEFSLSYAGFLLFIGLRGLAFTVAPVFGVVVAVVVLTEAIQTGFVFSMDPLTPKIERLSPAENFKRIFLSLQGLVELVKSIVKIVLVFWISWTAVREELPYLVGIIDSSLWEAIRLGASIAYKVVMRVAIFYLGIAVLDYFYRRFEYMKGLRMSRQEVKEEYKRLEGDPLIKQRIRELQRQAAYQRMMAAVPQADVVVTNPVEVAVALQYNTAKMKSPSVVAKGERLVAEEIRKIAEESLVPIVENPPLARSLYRTVKVGQEIPSELYQAVAEVLAFVYKLKRERVEARKKELGPLRGTRSP